MEIGEKLGDMNYEWQQTTSKPKKKSGPPPKMKKLQRWSDENELAFQIGDMHGEAFINSD